MEPTRPVPVHAVVDEPHFTITVAADEAAAARYADALWAVSQVASRHMGTSSKTLAPRDYKRIMADLYRDTRAALGLPL